MIKRSTWIMLGVFALLLAVVLLVQRIGPQDELADIPTEAVRPNVYDFTVEEIALLRIANLDGKAVEIERLGEVWIMTQPAAPAEQVDQTRLAGLLAQLLTLRLVTENVINAPLQALQLDPAPYVLTVTLVSSESYVLDIGDNAVTNTGYYVSLNGQAPQLAGKSVLDQFIGLLDSPPYLPTPVPTVEIPTAAP